METREFFKDFDWEEWERSWDKIDYTHPLLSLTIKVTPFKDFIKDYIWVYPDTAVFSGIENKVIEMPILVFMNYDNRKIEVINLMGLYFFELLKFSDFLFIETKAAGTLVLRGNMPESFKGDRGTRDKWKSYAKAIERRQNERRTTGWIPTAEVGR